MIDTGLSLLERSTTNVVARFGGDEFVVLCSGTRADRLGGEFAAAALARDYPDLSRSAGLADFDPRSDDTIEDLLRASDADLDRVKAEHARRRRQTVR